MYTVVQSRKGSNCLLFKCAVTAFRLLEQYTDAGRRLGLSLLYFVICIGLIARIRDGEWLPPITLSARGTTLDVRF